MRHLLYILEREGCWLSSTLRLLSLSYLRTSRTFSLSFAFSDRSLMVSKYIQYVMDGAQNEGIIREIELVGEINIEEVLQHPEDYRTLRLNAGVSHNHELCLVNAPPGMIPTELIQFFGSSLGHISAIRILRHTESVNDADYFAILKMKDAESCALVYREYHGQVLSSVENSYCLLLPIKEAVDQTLSLNVAGDFACDDLEGQSSCPVCLDFFDEAHPMSFTTCCNHRFHMNCLLRLEGALCPVCRFRHDCELELCSECFVCGWQGAQLDAMRFHVDEELTSVPPVDLWLCLICGFTGCGASHGGHIQQHYEETLHTYAQNCDSRQVWDFAGDGYVHSLVLKDSSLLQLDAEEAQGGSAPQLTPFHIEQQALWRTDQGPDGGKGSDQEASLVNAKLEAAARHYNQLLAWQMEQNRLLYETRLQRIRDSVPSADSNKTGQLSKSTSGALSAGPAGKAKSSGSSASFRAEKGPRASTSSTSGSSWRENMLSSLRSEKSKVARQLEAAQERLARARQEADLLGDLHAGLSGNRDEWQRRVDFAAAALRDQELVHKLETSRLEGKVCSLMSKLDQISKTETGSKQSVSHDTGTSSAIDEGDEEQA